MEFKVVIWGLGTNGKNLIDVLGKDNVIAIIDSNPAKLELGRYKGISIITFENFLQKYRDYYVVITPMKHKEIEEMLKMEGINRYFVQSESQASNILIKSVIDNSFLERLPIEKDKFYKIRGVDLFAVYLYLCMKKNNILAELLDFDMNEFKSVISINNLEWQKKLEAIYVDTATVCASKENANTITCEYWNELLYKAWKTDIERFKNIALGKRIFIVATGPSIRKEDLELLHQRGELTMSMNGIIYFLDKVKWRPTYYVVSDGIAIREYEEFCGEQEIMQETEKFFSDNYLNFWEQPRNATYHCFRQKQQPYEIKFSDDCSDGIYAGLTVVYACLQLAAYMGTKEIYLLGCDFSFSKDISSEENHCYKRKTSGYAFDYENVEKAYKKAKEYADTRGIKIYNATRGGKLEVFERVDFDCLFQE